MELLQKLTLYDLLGYTIPGIIFLWCCVGNGFLYDLVLLEDNGTVYWLVMVIIGYIAGMAIAEIMEFFTKMIGWLCERFKLDKKYWNYLCKVYGISKAELKRALKEAKQDGIEQCNGAGKILKKYRSYIFSDIQTDEKYSRLHNYASAELLCRNMMAVFIAALVMELQAPALPEVVICIIGTVCFAFRFMQFKERKMGYAACWFIQKHMVSKK